MIDLNTERQRRIDIADRDVLERRLRRLQARQVLRIAAVAKQKQQLDESVDRAAQEIENIEEMLR